MKHLVRREAQSPRSLLPSPCPLSSSRGHTLEPGGGTGLLAAHPHSQTDNFRPYKSSLEYGARLFLLHLVVVIYYRVPLLQPLFLALLILVQTTLPITWPLSSLESFPPMSLSSCNSSFLPWPFHRPGHDQGSEILLFKHHLLVPFDLINFSIFILSTSLFLSFK